MRGTGGNSGERLSGGAGPVLEDDLSGQRRQRKDDVEVRHGQQFGLSMREPFGARQPLAFWAMAVAAGVVGDARPAAIIALLDVTAEHRSTRPRCPVRACRNASPWRRKTSATSRTGAICVRSAGRHDHETEPAERIERPVLSRPGNSQRCGRANRQ